MLLLPRESYALINFGTDLSYQQNDNENAGETTSTVQERFSLYFNINSKPSSRLSLAGILRLDVLQDKADPGSESTELQPNIDMRISSNAVQLGMGYRQIIRNESIIAATGTTNLRSDSDDWYADTSIRAGKLPSMRIRYSVRDQSQTSDGTTTIKTNTDDLQGSLNYKLGPLFINADYRYQTTNDKLTGLITDSSQIAGQANLNQRIGSKMNIGLRDDYNQDNTKTNSVETSKRYSNLSELRIVYNPFRGLNLSSTYSYRISDDQLSGSGKTIETNWYSSFNYAFPKYLRVYGSYLTLNTDNLGGGSTTTSSTSTDPATSTTTITTVNTTSQASTTLNNNTIAGLNFANSFGRYNFTLRYERRMNSVSTDQEGTTTATTITTITTTPPSTTTTTTTATTPSTSTKNDVTSNNLDWVLSTHLKPYLLVTLSESYIGSTDDSGNNTNNRFRLKVDLGPLKNLSLNPYFDYDTATVADGTETVTKELVVPANFRIFLHQKLELYISDNFRWSSSETASLVNTSQNNSALIRINLLKPFPGAIIGGDASFNTSSTNGGASTSTSAYSLRVNWSKMPHTFAANFRYQTGTNTAASASASLLYGLVVKLRKLQLNLQARYDYSIVMSSPNSTAQTIYMLLSLKK